MGIVSEGRGSYKKAQSEKIKARVLKYVSKKPGKTSGEYAKEIGICRQTFRKHLLALQAENKLPA